MLEHDSAATAASAQSAPRSGRILSPAQMNAAITNGLATSPLRRQDIQRYDGAWWQQSSHGWIEYTDSAAIATLDARAASITSQQDVVMRRAAIRAAAERTVRPTEEG